MTEHTVDLDAESIWVEDAWLTREQLATLIRAKLDHGDYGIGALSLALEKLNRAISEARLVAARVPADLANALEARAQLQKSSTSVVLRAALEAFLRTGGAVPGQQPAVPSQAAAAPAIPAATIATTHFPPRGQPQSMGRADTLPPSPGISSILPSLTVEPARPEDAAAAVVLRPKGQPAGTAGRETMENQVEHAWFQGGPKRGG